MGFSYLVHAVLGVKISHNDLKILEVLDEYIKRKEIQIYTVENEYFKENLVFLIPANYTPGKIGRHSGDSQELPTPAATDVEQFLRILQNKGLNLAYKLHLVNEHL